MGIIITSLTIKNKKKSFSRLEPPIGALPRKNIEHWWVGWMARAWFTISPEVNLVLEGR